MTISRWGVPYTRPATQSKGYDVCVVYSSPLHFLTPPAPLGSLCFLSKGDPHSLGVGENGNKTLRMRAADFLLWESSYYLGMCQSWIDRAESSWVELSLAESSWVELSQAELSYEKSLWNRMLDGACIKQIISFNHCQARSNSTTHMYCPSGGIPRPKAKGGWDCFFTFGGLLCTWPVKLSYRNQSPNCIDIMSSRVLHLPSVCVLCMY